jgi:PKD repeat protein
MDFGSGTPSILSDSLTSVTYFRVVLGCSFSTLSDTSSVYTIYVSDLPKPIISINPPAPAYCGAAAGAITITASGASSFVWQPATGLDNATSAIVNASPLLTTQYALLGTDDNGCQNILNVNVLVSAPPVLTMSATPPVICVGDSTRIRVFAQGFGGPGGGNIYAWTPGGQTTSNFNDTPITDSQYFVTVTNVAGCVNNDSISVQVLPNLATNFTYSVDGLNVTLNNLSEGDTATIWDMGDGDILNSHNAIYTYASEGTYDVTLISLGNCYNDTLVQSITVGPAGFEAINNASYLNVFPNPVNNLINVRFNAQANNSVLSIINELGQELNTVQLKTISGQIHNQKIDVSYLPEGIYVMRIVSSTNQSSVRFVKN